MSCCWTSLLPIVIVFITLVPWILYSFEIMLCNIPLYIISIYEVYYFIGYKRFLAFPILKKRYKRFLAFTTLKKNKRFLAFPSPKKGYI